MPTADQVEVLFGHGPFPHFRRSLGLFRPIGTDVVARAITSVLIGWFPLLILVLLGSLQGQGSAASFFTDFGTHARSLIAAPLLILCEVLCLRRLAETANQFVKSGIIEQRNDPDFNALVGSTRALLNGTLAEILAIIFAYVIVFSLVGHLPQLGVRPWTTRDGNSAAMSFAGWWYAFVSLPLLLILFFGWLWRVFLWSRFLIRIATMKLRLIAAHPDRASGLKFLNSSVIAFLPLAFTFGVVAAGSVANRILYQGATTEKIQITVAGLIVFVLVLFVGPLLVFVWKLHSKKVEGIFSYGGLADDVGRQFEEKWLQNYEKFKTSALEAADFSATTDLYQVVANVHDMKVLPFELRAVVSLIIVTLLPFIPVVLMTMPVKLILSELARLLV
jgi:hypothetical protein